MPRNTVLRSAVLLSSFWSIGCSSNNSNPAIILSDSSVSDVSTDRNAVGDSTVVEQCLPAFQAPPPPLTSLHSCTEEYWRCKSLGRSADECSSLAANGPNCEQCFVQTYYWAATNLNDEKNCAAEYGCFDGCMQPCYVVSDVDTCYNQRKMAECAEPLATLKTCVRDLLSSGAPAVGLVQDVYEGRGPCGALVGDAGVDDSGSNDSSFGDAGL